MNFSSNRVIPAEILKEIFNYVIIYKVPENTYIINEKGGARITHGPGALIIKKNQLKPCLTVCRSWHSVVMNSFYNTGMQVKLTSDYKFKPLLDDLTQYPSSFRLKVKCIRLTDKCEGEHESTMFRSIVNLCPNIIELKFEYPEVYQDLQVLVDQPEASLLLPNIQKIHLRNMEFGFPSTRRLHLTVNYRFRATITSLRITDFGVNTALKKFGGLYKYISSFPNLKYLKIMCEHYTKNVQTINLELLLESARKLEVLKIYNGGGSINVETTTKIDNSLDELMMIPHHQNTKPMKLYLKVNKLNMDVLNCIMDRIKNVDTLRISTRTNYDTVNTIEVDKMIFNKFIFYCKAFNKAIVNIHKDNSNHMNFHNIEKRTFVMSDTDSDNPKSEEEYDEESDYDSDNLFGGGGGGGGNRNRFFGGGSDNYGSDDYESDDIFY